MSWVERIRRLMRPRAATEVLLNDGLALAMDWGESWLSPIQERLSRIHPSLNASELDEVNETCQQAMRLGHELVYDLVHRKRQVVDEHAFAASMLATHPWLTTPNIARLLRQGLYYASKTGGVAG